MHLETACEAIRAGQCLEVSYDGWRRVIEVHACGYTREGDAIMRVWQVSGGSSSGQGTGWKLMRLDAAWSVAIMDAKSGAPRQGYKRGDEAIGRIVCQA